MLEALISVGTTDVELEGASNPVCDEEPALEVPPIAFAMNASWKYRNSHIIETIINTISLRP